LLKGEDNCFEGIYSLLFSIISL